MGIRRAATTAAVTAGALGTATLGLSPPAEATCASLFGFSTDPARCTSSALSVAVAIGQDAAADATGLLGVAFAAGTNSFAQARTLGLAFTVGENSTSGSYGILSPALNLGANGIAATGDGVLSLAVNLSLATTQQSYAGAFGSGNLAVSLFGDSTQSPAGHQVVAQGGGLNVAASIFQTNSAIFAGGGLLNTAVGLGGADNRVSAADGVFNYARQLGGNDNYVQAGGDQGQGNGFFNAAFSILGNGAEPLPGLFQANTVLAGPGPLAIAGSIGQEGSAQGVVQTGPGININSKGPIPLRVPAGARTGATSSVLATAPVSAATTTTAISRVKAKPGRGGTTAAASGVKSPGSVAARTSRSR